MSVVMAMLVSVLMVAATLITLQRVLSLKRIAGLATPIDIAFSVGLFFVFAGTLAGMVIAIIAGLFMAITLSVLGRLVGKERPTMRRTNWYRGFYNPSWRTV